MAEGRIEQPSQAYEACELPLLYSAIYDTHPNPASEEATQLLICNNKNKKIKSED